MRRAVALILASAMAAAPAAAQFEGTINMKMAEGSEGLASGVAVKILIKGDKQATIVTMPASAGPMAGLEMRSILDTKANTVTMLMPLPPAMAKMPGMTDAKGMKNVMDFSKIQPDSTSGDKVSVKNLGTHEKVAGLDCDDYEVTSKKDVTRVCITHSVGRFMFPQMGGPMGRGRNSSAPAWTEMFGDKPSFPLKVWTPDGKVEMEVTSVDRGSVPASMFEVPAGYVDMAAMMRGRGGV